MAYARGLIPLRYDNGNPYNGAAVPCQVLASYATALFVGDPVIAVGGVTTAIATESQYKNEAAFLTINAAAAGGVIYGVIVGFEPQRGDLSKQYLPASTGGVAYVARASQDLIFKVGEDTTTDALELTDIGSAVDLATGAGGSTTTGYSSFVLDSNTEGTVAKQCYLRGLYSEPGNIDNVDSATDDDTVWEVSIMEIQFHPAPDGVGV